MDTYLQFRLTIEEKKKIIDNMNKVGFRSFSDFARVVLLNYKGGSND